MILAGDIGGTKSNIGLFDVQQGKLVRVAHKRYSSHEHAGLQEIVQDFLAKNPAKITAASFGVAGPVVDNRVHGTNLPWIVDGAAVAALSGPAARANFERSRSHRFRRRSAFAQRSGDDLRRRAAAHGNLRGDRGGHRPGRSHSFLGRKARIWPWAPKAGMPTSRRTRRSRRAVEISARAGRLRQH